MNEFTWRRWGAGCAALGLAFACNVDTAGITFVDDNLFDSAAGEPGSSNEAGTPSSGGNVASGGSSSKAGAAGKPSGGTSTASGGTGTLSGGTGTGGTSVTPAGGMNTGGMPPLQCPVAAGDPMQPLIDNFDDGNSGLPMVAGRAGGWYMINDGTGTQKPPADPNVPPRPETTGYDGKGYALHTSGTGFMDWGAGVGVTLSNVPNLGACPYDASRHTGVRFYLQGVVKSMDAKLRFHLITTEVSDVAFGGTCDPAREKCYDSYSFDLDVVPMAWKRIDVPFSVLAQAGWGTEKPLRLNHVLNLEVVTTGPTEMFDFWIDQVEFY